MRITVNFRNPGDGTITLWNLVSFSYIVVSRSFSGAYSDIWATISSVSNPGDTALLAPAAVDPIGTYYLVAGAQCSIYQDPNFVSRGTGVCNPAGATAVNGLATGGSTVIHAYIMGFQYNPAKNTDNYLFASVLPKTLVASFPSD